MIFGKDKKALADAYVAMMQSSAWKDLEEYLEGEVMKSLDRSDSKPARELVIGQNCEERGIRKGIETVLKYVEQKIEGL